MKALIVEDEHGSYENLRKLIIKLYPDAIVDGPVPSAEMLRELLLRLTDYDMVFSDIQLEDGVCFTALEGMPASVPVIFTTAYDEFALAAFRANGIAYLLKPIDKGELQRAIENALTFKRGTQNLAGLLSDYGIGQRSSYKTRFLINDMHGAHMIKTDDICYFEKYNDVIKAYMRSGIAETMPLPSLEALEMQLDPAQFFRANRQCIININAVERLNYNWRQSMTVLIANHPKAQIRVSRERVADLRTWLSA